MGYAVYTSNDCPYPDEELFLRFCKFEILPLASDSSTWKLYTRRVFWNSNSANRLRHPTVSDGVDIPPFLYRISIFPTRIHILTRYITPVASNLLVLVSSLSLGSQFGIDDTEYQLFAFNTRYHSTGITFPYCPKYLTNGSKSTSMSTCSKKSYDLPILTAKIFPYHYALPSLP